VVDNAGYAALTEIVGSNPKGGMDVCVRLVSVCVALCVGSGIGSKEPANRSAYQIQYVIAVILNLVFKV
jgi:hypothetical protein